MPNSRAKGIRGELEVRDLFRAQGYEAERGQQHAGGIDSPDVKHSMAGYHIEVKRVEALQLYPAMQQAEDDASGGRAPVVFHKKNRRDWLVIMKADDFFKLVKENEALRHQMDRTLSPPVVVRSKKDLETLVHDYDAGRAMGDPEFSDDHS
jgi:hypothetical protein